MKQDLTGKTYGQLTVLHFDSTLNKWICRCTCGNQHTTTTGHLNAKRTTRCWPCSVKARSQRQRYRRCPYRSKYPREVKRWYAMRNRCMNPNNIMYPHYGGRGITIAPEWNSFKQFITDMGPLPSPQHQIDRIDNDGPYCKANCRWATQLQQMRNNRRNRVLTFKGESHCMSEWAEILGLSYGGLKWRLRHWSVEDALSRSRHH